MSQQAQYCRRYDDVTSTAVTLYRTIHQPSLCTFLVGMRNPPSRDYPRHSVSATSSSEGYHILLFFAPLKIDRKIRGIAGKSEGEDALETIDVLRWVMTETCDDITHYVPRGPARAGLFQKERCLDQF
ncbi:hypothetical protein F5146DRAFT_69897 [Armillaria mellea]|nr:hypothetical protein F5146DRAFT_69897 [Armillaria mellea]